MKFEILYVMELTGLMIVYVVFLVWDLVLNLRQLVYLDTVDWRFYFRYIRIDLLCLI